MYSATFDNTRSYTEPGRSIPGRKETDMYRSWSTPEEIAQAKARITEEFISRYYEFLEDVPNGGK